MVTRCIFLVTLTTLFFGCSKLTQENYDKLKVGMEYREVVSILGKPDSCSDTLVAKNCVWGSDRKNITVNFLGDKIIIYTSRSIK
ncbi:MAG TPA: DUF3862 domain-containing protein [Geobacteraceae bacterium]|nr:DUF3862 domain-containing protein [Geobacteraceae bacterium]